LVVEVVSSGDRETECNAKVQVWLDAGVRLVWAVYPVSREVTVHRPAKPVVTFAATNKADVLDGGDVVPGFSYPVAGLVD
jgi:Uma2 family endonuclease